jgi:aldose 1-epimerase
VDGARAVRRRGDRRHRRRARSGYPFRLAAAIDHALAPDRLTVTLRVRNVGAEPAPFGAGFHPYLAVGAQDDGGIADAELELPARTELVVDDGGLPTGERRPFDGSVGRIGDRALDTPLTDLDRDADGWARVRLRSAALGHRRAGRRRAVAVAAGLHR